MDLMGQCRGDEHCADEELARQKGRGGTPG